MGKNSCQKFQFLTLKKIQILKKTMEKYFVKPTYCCEKINSPEISVDWRISSPKWWKNKNSVSLHKSFVKMNGSQKWIHGIFHVFIEIRSCRHLHERFNQAAKWFHDFFPFFRECWTSFTNFSPLQIISKKMKSPKLNWVFCLHMLTLFSTRARICQLNIQNKNNNKTVS